MKKKQPKQLKDAKKISGLIIKVNDEISIRADKYQYIVHFRSDYWYLDSLGACFEEIFNEQVKINLAENKKKEMNEIIRIIKETSNWLRDIFRSIENPKLKRD